MPLARDRTPTSGVQGCDDVDEVAQAGDSGGATEEVHLGRLRWRSTARACWTSTSTAATPSVAANHPWTSGRAGDAGQTRRGNTAAIWVIADAQYRVVAYATLSMTGIDRSASPRTLASGTPTVIPALLIGCLAVGQSAAGLGLGTQLVKHVLATAGRAQLQGRLPSGCGRA